MVRLIGKLPFIAYTKLRPTLILFCSVNKKCNKNAVKIISKSLKGKLEALNATIMLQKSDFFSFRQNCPAINSKCAINLDVSRLLNSQ